MNNKDNSNASTKYYPTAAHWGTGIAEVEAGRLVAIHGSPNDPNPSPIWQGFVDAVYHKTRVRRPMVRKSFLSNPELSDPGRRGREPFVAVSWDEALDLAASELDRVRKKHGNESIFAGSYGWASAGRFHHSQSQIHRFMNSIGGYTRSLDNYSFAAALVLMPHIVGNYYRVLLEHTVWPVVARHGNLVVMFGGIPVKNTQIAPGGIGRHSLADMMTECRKSGVEFINISPLKSDAAEVLDAEWIAPRPHTDTAIMLAIAHTLVVNDLHDQVFLDKHTVGFDRFRSYLMGETDGLSKNAAWASHISGISAETIEGLARRMASRRTLLCMSVSLQRAHYGEQPIWMTVTLAAMLGQIGIPGGGFGIGYGSDAVIGQPVHDISWPALPQGTNPIDRYIPVARIADLLLNPGAKYDYNGQRLTYPDIRLLYWAGGNPFHHHQDINRLVEAFRRPETIIVNEISWTPTARFADIVFPITSTLERNDLCMSRPDSELVAMHKVIEPVGESRSDFDVFSGLAGRLGVDEHFTEDRDVAEWLREMWKRARIQAADAGFKLSEFEVFWEKGIERIPDPADTQVLLEAFRRDPENYPLDTPSGKIEIFSETIASFGYDDCPGHPVWLEPCEWLGSTKAEKFPLHLMSNQPKSKLHSQFDCGRASKALKLNGREQVTMHPDDAEARNLSDGDVARIYNERGACLAGVKLCRDIRSGVIQLSTGAWYDPIDYEGNQALDKHGNPNMLTIDLGTSKLAQGPSSNTALVEIELYQGKIPEVTAFEPPVIEERLSTVETKVKLVSEQGRL